MDADNERESSPSQPRRAGRPRISPEPNNAVSTWLPVSTHDKLIELAKQHRTSVSHVLRQIVFLRLK